jgi:hypothetical protein
MERFSVVIYCFCALLLFRGWKFGILPEIETLTIQMLVLVGTVLFLVTSLRMELD